MIQRRRLACKVSTTQVGTNNAMLAVLTLQASLAFVVYTQGYTVG